MKHTTANAMSLRAKINNYAKEHGILAQVVLQNYMFECLLDRISRSKYVETVLAEKFETIIARGILNTRPRDFYDVYILTKTQGYNTEILREAVFATAEHRGTKSIMESEIISRLTVIENSKDLQSQWSKYQKKFPYAKDITYQETVNAIKEVIHEIHI